MIKCPLEDLQQWLKKSKIDAIILPMKDRFQNEYLPIYENRIQYLTGFTGSAGMLFVTQTACHLSVDSRYTEQASQQVDQAKVNIGSYEKRAGFSWLKNLFPKGFSLAFDPWLHTIHSIQTLEKTISFLNGKLLPLEQNPVDLMWVNRPHHSKKEAYLLESQITGMHSIEKTKNLCQVFKTTPAQTAFIGDVTASNWLLNIRGADLPHTPVLFVYAFLKASHQIDVFCDLSQLPTPIRTTLKDHVLFHDWQDLKLYLKTCETLYLPVEHTPYALLQLCKTQKCNVCLGHDFYSLAKAQKNAIEAHGMEICHLEDGLAVTRFLYEISCSSKANKLTELTAVALLEEKRKLSTTYLSPSFSTISALDAHAARPHYTVTPESSTAFKEAALYLIDSGGHYTTGTTDITRTLYLKESPSNLLKRHFTLVLKGHIALASCHFPEGTTGVSLDALARQFLWHEGLDFGHGTGHGVGFRLNVHEVPPSISPRASNQPLLEGMILSNEPGFYKPGSYGIRIENLMIVQKSAKKKNFLCFKTLSLAPIDRKMIDKNLLTEPEIHWLNSYHARVYEAHAPFLKPDERTWLSTETASL
jgi:Xaa-Pro aminopeptidase